MREKRIRVKNRYIGRIAISSPSAYKKTYDLIKSEIGDEIDRLYVSDVQDTYVFYHNGEVISLPFDIREDMDSHLVKNQINISEGYSNGFYKKYEIRKVQPTKIINRYSTVGTSISIFKKHCDKHMLEYDYFEATDPQMSGSMGLSFKFKYVGVKTIKIYDTLAFYEKGDVSSATFRSACNRNGWDICDFEITPTSHGNHKCIKSETKDTFKQNTVDYSVHENTLFRHPSSLFGNGFKTICDENGWDMNNFEFIRQDSCPMGDAMITMQEGFYVHKDRLDEPKRAELEIRRLRLIESKYKELLEIMFKK
ncbi:MAG: hypothetical protein ACRCZ0_04910 [Cetobacterium sp.]